MGVAALHGEGVGGSFDRTLQSSVRPVSFQFAYMSLSLTAPSESRPRPFPQNPPGVLVHRFENGLELILREDRSAPVVSVQAWCRAGSVDEGKWIGAGLSHVLEHMLFKGTTTRGPGRIDQEVQAAGGFLNAYT